MLSNSYPFSVATMLIETFLSKIFVLRTRELFSSLLSNVESAVFNISSILTAFNRPKEGRDISVPTRELILLSITGISLKFSLSGISFTLK